MSPTEDTPKHPRKPRARRKADPIREAASEAGAASGTGNGREWVDFDAPAESWDPWGEGDGDGDHEERGPNRSMGEWLEALVPVEAQLHFYNAGREFAAGVQTTLEFHMRRGEGDDGGGRPLHIEIE